MEEREVHVFNDLDHVEELKKSDPMELWSFHFVFELSETNKRLSDLPLKVEGKREHHKVERIFM